MLPARARFRILGIVSASIAAVSLLAILLLAVPLAHAQIYKWVDEHGVVHYTSTPPPSDREAEQVTAASESSDDAEEDGSEPSPEDEADEAADEGSGSDRSTVCEVAVGEIPSSVDTYLEGARQNLKDGQITQEEYDEVKSRMRTLEAHLTVPDCMRAEGRHLQLYACISESHGDAMVACRSLLPED